jgi:hypothetical protein
MMGEALVRLVHVICTIMYESNLLFFYETFYKTNDHYEISDMRSYTLLDQ